MVSTKAQLWWSEEEEKGEEKNSRVMGAFQTLVGLWSSTKCCLSLYFTYIPYTYKKYVALRIGKIPKSVSDSFYFYFDMILGHIWITYMEVISWTIQFIWFFKEF